MFSLLRFFSLVFFSLQGRRRSWLYGDGLALSAKVWEVSLFSSCYEGGVDDWFRRSQLASVGLGLLFFCFGSEVGIAEMERSFLLPFRE